MLDEKVLPVLQSKQSGGQGNTQCNSFAQERGSVFCLLYCASYPTTLSYSLDLDSIKVVLVSFFFGF